MTAATGIPHVAHTWFHVPVTSVVRMAGWLAGWGVGFRPFFLLLLLLPGPGRKHVVVLELLPTALSLTSDGSDPWARANNKNVEATHLSNRSKPRLRRRATQP